MEVEDNNNLVVMQQSHATTYPRNKRRTRFSEPLFWYDIQNLPDSLLVEILARLPANSIFKFKCVSKHWQTLISHPSFYQRHSSLSSLLPFRIVYRYIYVSNFKELIDRFQPEIYSTSSEFSVLYLSGIDQERERENNEHFKVLAMSNGLVLFQATRTSTHYYICDMITRRWVMTLPESSYRVMTLPESSYEYAFGEGLVSRVKENVVISYRVVRVILYRHPLGYLILQMLSSETGEWFGYTLPCSTPIQLFKRGVGPICFNGILHWFIHDHGMVAFDPYKEPKSCRIIRLPDDINTESVLKHDGAYRLCDGCQGTLRYFQVEPEASELYCFSMWVMKDYEKGEWCCEFKVRRRDLHSSDAELSSWLLKATFLPLSFHPLDVNVVYLRCIELGWIVTYHVQDRRLDVACKQIGDAEDLSWRVVVPFVLPRWPANVPVPRRFDLRPFKFQPLAGL
ncbi:putative F-box domain-containing protein [Tanacetum coccineum]